MGKRKKTVSFLSDIDQKKNASESGQDSVCAYGRACVRVCVHTVRQNRKERLMQKKWSHIDPQLFGPLDEKEVSLKVNQELILHEMLNWKLSG